MDKTLSEIQNRYSQETQGNVNLSCGTNIELAGLRNGEYVLDLGCGRGEETLNAARAVGPTGKVIGLDITEEMLVIAKNAAIKTGIDNVQFISGHIEKLPFGDQSFDVVLSNCVINHAKDKLKAYQEIFRVLKPGGRMLISDIVALEDIPSEVRNDEKAWARCFAGAENKEEYFRTILEAGFSKTETLKYREYAKEGYQIASVTFYALKEKGGEDDEKNN